jgi:hypothetical protein
MSKNVDVERLLDHVVWNFQQSLSRDNSSVVDQDGDLNHTSVHYNFCIFE